MRHKNLLHLLIHNIHKECFCVFLCCVFLQQMMFTPLMFSWKAHTDSTEEEILSAATAKITKIKPVCLSLPDNHYYTAVFLYTSKSTCHKSLLIFTKSSFVLPFTSCIYKHFPERVSGMQKLSTLKWSSVTRWYQSNGSTMVIMLFQVQISSC